MQVCEERGKPEYPRKNLSEQRQTQPTYDTESGNRSPATLATTALIECKGCWNDDVIAADYTLVVENKTGDSM